MTSSQVTDMERTLRLVPVLERSQLPKSSLRVRTFEGEAHLPSHSDRESELRGSSPPSDLPRRTIICSCIIWHHADTCDRRGWRKEVSRTCAARPGRTVSTVGDDAAPPLVPAERESSSRDLAGRQQRKDGQ